MLKEKSFHLISLGCAKNTVDSESMAQLLYRAGYHHVERERQAEVLIVNTCGFIGPAKDESLRVLGELALRKRKGQTLIAAGCLTQRYGAEVVRQVPGIDGILGTRRWMDIVEVVRELRASQHPQPLYHLPEAATVGSDEQGVLRAAVQGASAYLKIADGCRRPCAFCAIPLIKGTAASRPLPALVEEARRLQDLGVREIILIAQDTTDYGHDLGMKDGLAQLLEQLVGAVPGMDWIRIMYAYPGYVTDRLIEVMASQPQIVPYLDMPLQHAHPDTLRRMRRPANLEWVYRTLEKMRSAMPDLALRTTFIVGYPGETESEFQALLDFIQAVRFDRVGAFQFSFEPGTSSEPLGDPVPAQEKQERYERLMTIQQRISLEKNQAWVGKTLQVLVEGQGEGLSLGRSYRDAPEIDGLVIIENELPAGEMLPVTITGAMAYDLSGVAQASTVPLIIPRTMSTASSPDFTTTEARFAIDTMQEASRLVTQIQSELVATALTKEDRSPVTVADFACQALVAYRLMQAFPADGLLAEEDSSSLRPHPDVLKQVSGYVGRCVPRADSEQVCDWIDHGRTGPGQKPASQDAGGGRTWVLDPVDGTKGFLRGDQYALALALLVDGKVQLGVLGCPRLDPSAQPADGSGALFIALGGAGAWAADIEKPDSFRRLHVSRRCEPAEARVLRSFEAGHTNISRIDGFMHALDCQAEPVRMDSQAKYALLAAGRGDLLLRLLSASQPDYREMIWDQAAGSILLEEAGGRISDLRGEALDFRLGRTLANNYGILASNGCLHVAALNALSQIDA